MNLLAIETATRQLSVALQVGDRHVSRSARAASGGSEFLLPWIQALLAETGSRFDDIEAIAFGAGPGSFTGLRLACGIAQGLAFGLQRPVIPVGSLAALAIASGEPRVYACLDARMNEVYVAAYEIDALGCHEVLAPRACAPAAAPRPPSEGFFACGDGFAVHDGPLRSALGGCFVAIDATLLPDASAVLTLAEGAPHTAVTAAEAKPIYLRDKVALDVGEQQALRAARLARS